MLYTDDDHSSSFQPEILPRMGDIFVYYQTGVFLTKYYNSYHKTATPVNIFLHWIQYLIPIIPKKGSLTNQYYSYGTQFPTLVWSSKRRVVLPAAKSHKRKVLSQEPDKA